MSPSPFLSRTCLYSIIDFTEFKEKIIKLLCKLTTKKRPPDVFVVCMATKKHRSAAVFRRFAMPAFPVTENF
ncbi:hypothetical protein BRYFOR_09826 [Marvinbryantia formatexigens DSM 14469]|uniref:Uncharacterized protein n=1 Tax=Marvinbryantia formatexigens DSM 14469 TaxID=478749 RepID=C6LMC7_9FIRM|nr:hypothetical protein BRYFOR_09826 [Marvinbryantia formatexigens DSM 14469]